MAKPKTEPNIHPLDKGKEEFPDHAIEALARCALPLIRAYYESEEGQREFAEWEEKRNRKKATKRIQ